MFLNLILVHFYFNAVVVQINNQKNIMLVMMFSDSGFISELYIILSLLSVSSLVA